jgi:hypothetical protein
MQSARSSHHWLCRFSARFLALRGDLPWQRVVARAVAAYPYCSDQDPDEAALMAASRSAREQARRPLGGRSDERTATQLGAP